jgi:hypothetical protein
LSKTPSIQVIPSNSCIYNLFSITF